MQQRSASFAVADDFSSMFNNFLANNNSNRRLSTASMNSSNNNDSSSSYRHTDPLTAAYRQVDGAESWASEVPFPDYDHQNKNTSQSKSATATRRGSDQHHHRRPSSTSTATSRQQQQHQQQQQQSYYRRSNSTTSSMMMSNSNNNNKSSPLNQSSSASVTPTEFAVIRSLFGRGDEAHNQTTDTARKLLPHVDLRWLVGSLQNNRVNYSATSSRTKDMSDMITESFQKNTRPPARSKTIKNLFGNIESISENWSRRDYLTGSDLIGGNTNPDLMLINSPRSAITLLRTGTDLHQLVNQVATAYSVNPLEARQSATSKQRVSGDRDHQLLAKQRRKQLEGQHEVNEKLAYLKRVYDDICNTTTLQDIFDMRDAEHKKRQVVIHRPPSRVVDRSMSIHSKQSELNETTVFNKETSVERTKMRTEEAARRRKEMLESRSKMESQRSMRRGEVHHSHLRAKIFNDIEAREAAALQCQRVYNFEKKVV